MVDSKENDKFDLGIKGLRGKWDGSELQSPSNPSSQGE